MYKNFAKFTNEDAWHFGEEVQNIIKQRQLKPVRIRVVKDGDIIFQYMMEGKKGDEWLNKKQRTVEHTHQSSLYVYNHQQYYPEFLKEDYAICGVGYHLLIENVYRGCLIVSGLDHQEDHKLILEALGGMDK